MNNIFIIGCKGIPARYGGFETFTDNLISRKQSKEIQYYVTCLSTQRTEQESFMYNGAICKNIFVPSFGSAKAILYDVKSLEWSLSVIDQKKLRHGYVYILGCTIGPLINIFKRRFEKRNFKVYLNPDGHEWKRDKWPYFVKKYLKYAEKSMIKAADLVVCDSTSIERYVNDDYKKFRPSTKYISYGSDLTSSKLTSSSTKVRKYFNSFSINEDGYYLVVGRFVPENNYETIIRNFMLSNTKRDLVIITNYKNNKFFDWLKNNTGFDTDKRIKFVGTVYDAELLKYIRTNAFAYIHGHSVGGTNPSLLEALGLTKLNLLYNIGFNREVAGTAALYWDKNNNDLARLIDQVDNLDNNAKDKYSMEAKAVIKSRYSWNKIISEYEDLFEY